MHLRLVFTNESCHIKGERGSQKPHLCQNKLLEVDILSQCHLGCVDGKDAPLGLDIGQGKFNFPVYPSRPDERRIQGVDAVCGHDHLWPDAPSDSEVLQRACTLRILWQYLQDS